MKEEKTTRQALLFIKNLWLKHIKGNLFRVNVENQPEIQRVKIENQPDIQSVRLINHKDIQKVQVMNETSLDGFVDDLSLIFKNQLEKIEQLKDNKDIIAKLDELKPKEGKKTTEDNLSTLKSIVTAIKNQKLIVDTTKIEKGLKTLENGIKKIKLEESFKPDDLKKIIESIYIPTPPKVVGISNEGNTRINPATEETLQSIAGLNIPKHDTSQLVYTDGVLTSVVYKLAGATVATETLIYTDGVFTGITIL